MKKIKLSPWLLLVLTALIWRLIYVYYPIINFHYLVPPGDDASGHLYYITKLMSEGLKVELEGYPMGFHILVVMITRILRSNPLSVIIWFTPLLLVIPIPAIYFAGKKIFKQEIIGAVAAVVWAFLALGPVRALGDGNYPNLLAASTIMPLVIMFLYLLSEKFSWKNLIYLMISLVLVISIHHLTSLFLIMIILPWLLVTVVYKLFQAKYNLNLILLGTIIFVSGCLAAWYLYKPLLGPLLTQLIQTGSLSSVLGSASSSISWNELLEINNPMLVYLGLSGFAVMALSKQKVFAKLLMVSWIGVLFALSMTSLAILPGRFVRELAIPLSLTSGILASYLWDGMRRSWRWMVLVLIVFAIGNDWVISFNRPYALPDPYQSLTRVPTSENSVFAIIDQITPPDDIVLANNGNPFVQYLIHRKVLVATTPEMAQKYLYGHGVKTIYISARPPLTPEDVYPYYKDYDQISTILSGSYQFRENTKLKNGTRVFTKIPGY